MSAAKRVPLKQAQTIKSLLKEMLDKPGIGEQITRHQAWLVWDQLVGKQIAARARPLRLRKGVLEVQVDHPVWMQQLQMMKPQILEKITEKVPQAGITDIYLRKGSSPAARKTPEPPEGASKQWLRTTLSDEEQRRIDGQLEAISDPELQQELRRLFSFQLKLDKNRDN